MRLSPPPFYSWLFFHRLFILSFETVVKFTGLSVYCGLSLGFHNYIHYA